MSQLACGHCLLDITCRRTRDGEEEAYSTTTTTTKNNGVIHRQPQGQQQEYQTSGQLHLPREPLSKMVYIAPRTWWEWRRAHLLADRAYKQDQHQLLRFEITKSLFKAISDEVGCWKSSMARHRHLQERPHRCSSTASRGRAREPHGHLGNHQGADLRGTWHRVLGTPIEGRKRTQAEEPNGSNT